MSKRILVVDDEPNIVLSLEYLMRQAGFEVSTATDGEEALEAIEKQPPDLILLDVMMPKHDGYEVCQRVRSRDEWKDVKIVMLTARGREIEREKGLSLGADDYVTKPFATQELVEKLRQVLGEAD